MHRLYVLEPGYRRGPPHEVALLADAVDEAHLGAGQGGREHQAGEPGACAHVGDHTGIAHRREPQPGERVGDMRLDAASGIGHRGRRHGVAFHRVQQCAELPPRHFGQAELLDQAGDPCPHRAQPGLPGGRPGAFHVKPFVPRETLPLHTVDVVYGVAGATTRWRSGSSPSEYVSTSARSRRSS